MKKAWLLLILLPLAAFAGESGTALKADTLRTEPFADAKVSGNLAKGESVEILAKKGAWLQIKNKKSTGWVRLLSVKRGGASGGSSAQDVVNVASGRAGTGKVVSTTGIRGLSAEELKTAKYNEAEMKKLDSYAVSPTDAEQFAKNGGLSKTSLAYFKEAK